MKPLYYAITTHAEIVKAYPDSFYDLDGYPVCHPVEILKATRTDDVEKLKAFKDEIIATYNQYNGRIVARLEEIENAKRDRDNAIEGLLK